MLYLPPRLLASLPLPVYVSPVPIRSSFRFIAVALVVACGGGSTPPAPAPATPLPPPPPQEPVVAFLSAPFAGQAVAVTPLTLLVSADNIGTMAPLADHAAALAWADSLLGATLLARAPEVKWVLPPELRKIARRAPTVAPDPDRMGQSVLRGKSMATVPDPLRSALRSLVALTGGRCALVPAALSFVPDATGPVRAELNLVFVDARTGQVLWRTVTWAVGATPSQALLKAIEIVLPV